jgi:hypothetical protein
MVCNLSIFEFFGVISYATAQFSYIQRFCEHSWATTDAKSNRPRVYVNPVKAADR